MWGSHFSNWMGNYCGWGTSYGHGPWLMGWVFPLLFWAIIIYVIVSIVRTLFAKRTRFDNDSALEILRNRFAAGEIDEKEYLSQKAVLNRM